MNCLSEQRDVFAAMSTEYSKCKTFQLFSTAVMIKKFREGQNLDTVLLVTCPLTSIIQDQLKERKSLGLDCAVIKGVKDVSNLVSGKTHALFA